MKLKDFIKERMNDSCSPSLDMCIFINDVETYYGYFGDIVSRIRNEYLEMEVESWNWFFTTFVIRVCGGQT